LASGLALLCVGFALGQQSAPTDYKLVSEDVLAAIDLANEIDGVEGRELRLSSAVIAGGGHIGLHSHRGDPTIVYIPSGVQGPHRSPAWPSAARQPRRLVDARRSRTAAGFRRSSEV